MDQRIGSYKRRELPIAFAPLFVWIFVIFFLSSDLGSMSHTSVLIRPILNFLFPNAPEETLQLYHAYVRKAAHFTEYAVLAALAFRAFGLSRAAFVSKRSKQLAIALVLTVASIDEFSQSFEPSRTGSPIDVLLDISGGITMLAIIWAISRFRQNKLNVPKRMQ